MDGSSKSPVAFEDTALCGLTKVTLHGVVSAELSGLVQSRGVIQRPPPSQSKRKAMVHSVEGGVHVVKLVGGLQG